MCLNLEHINHKLVEDKGYYDESIISKNEVAIIFNKLVKGLSSLNDTDEIEMWISAALSSEKRLLDAIYNFTNAPEGSEDEMYGEGYNRKKDYQVATHIDTSRKEIYITYEHEEFIDHAVGIEELYENKNFTIQYDLKISNELLEYFPVDIKAREAFLNVKKEFDRNDYVNLESIEVKEYNECKTIAFTMDISLYTEENGLQESMNIRTEFFENFIIAYLFNGRPVYKDSQLKRDVDNNPDEYVFYMELTALEVRMLLSYFKCLDDTKATIEQIDNSYNIYNIYFEFESFSIMVLKHMVIEIIGIEHD